LITRKPTPAAPEPPPDPSAFLVEFALAKNTGDPLGNFTVRVSPNWAPIAAARVRSVSTTSPRRARHPHALRGVATTAAAVYWTSNSETPCQRAF
jgi:hypothetical protein